MQYAACKANNQQPQRQPTQRAACFLPVSKNVALTFLLVPIVPLRINHHSITNKRGRRHPPATNLLGLSYELLCAMTRLTLIGGLGARPLQIGPEEETIFVSFLPSFLLFS